jgi:phenylacetate-CoA ligase
MAKERDAAALDHPAFAREGADPSRKPRKYTVATWLSTHVAWPLWEIDNGTRVLRGLRELDRTQWLSNDELADRQWLKLKRILSEAYAAVPYYRAQFKRAGIHPSAITSPEEFARLPILSKADLRREGEQLFHRDVDRRKLIESKTGGSTGKALTIYADWACRDLRNAAAIRSDRWAGWDFGRKRAALWGNPPVPGSWRARVREALHDRTVYLDTMNLNDATMAAFVEVWRAYRPEVLFGHSHSLFIWARWLHDRGIDDLRPVGIISTSMMLLPPERAVIESVFGCAVTDRYGCEEVGLIACECERHEGFHINVDHVYAEFLREDGSAADPDEPAALVVTDLINFGQPLIRYRIEDVASRSSRSCPCGRGLPLMETVVGRVADFLYRRDGSQVAGVSLVERTLTAFPGIEQMQIVQASIEELTLKVVRMGGYSPDVERRLISEFRSVFGEGVRIVFEYVERIPQLPSGKFRFAICSVAAPPRAEAAMAGRS